MNPLRIRLLLACPAAAALAACAAWSDVRGVATGGPQPAYELRGAKLATLQAEALRLCPAGYEVSRSWQRYGQPSDTWWSRWAIQATDFNGMGDRQAFLAIVCRDGGESASAPALVPVPAPLPMPTSSPPPVPVPNAAPATAPAASAASGASSASAAASSQ